jgi:hypothetical protein
MSLENFYGILSTICFGLAGLWWSSADGKQPDYQQNQQIEQIAYFQKQS